MKRRFVALALGLAATLMICAPASQANAKTFYWISHGSPADPVWTYFLAGAKQWGQDTGNTVNTSFHSGDVPSQQEAVRAAIAAKADGIVSSSPDPGSLVAVVRRPRRRASRSSTSTRPTPAPASTPMSAATSSRSASAGRSTWSTRAW
jgi:simple sugar transport system substrate-binding protein